MFLYLSQLLHNGLSVGFDGLDIIPLPRNPVVQGPHVVADSVDVVWKKFKKLIYSYSKRCIVGETFQVDQDLFHLLLVHFLKVLVSKNKIAQRLSNWKNQVH